MIRMTVDGVRAIKSEGRHTYPEECCGALLGHVSESGDARVVRVVSIHNGRDDERERRYLIAPDDIRRLEDAADRGGLEVLGFFHSHPDHPAVPSVFDREHAWPWYTYVILPVQDGEPGRPRAWRLADDRRTFVEVPLVLEPDALGATALGAHLAATAVGRRGGPRSVAPYVAGGRGGPEVLP